MGCRTEAQGVLVTFAPVKSNKKTSLEKKQTSRYSKKAKPLPKVKPPKKKAKPLRKVKPPKKKRQRKPASQTISVPLANQGDIEKPSLGFSGARGFWLLLALVKVARKYH